MIFWKRFYIVRETKRLMSTLPITKTPVSYLYFQIERIDFYRMKYRFILETDAAHGHRITTSQRKASHRYLYYDMPDSLQYTRTEIWKLRMQKNSQQTVRIPFYTDAMHLFEDEDILFMELYYEDICFFSWCDNGITRTKPGFYIVG